MTLAESNMSDHDPEEMSDPRRPRIAIMGEFSAGKSTLMNLLLGEPALPVKVTATQLPPVWISFGEAEPYQVDLDGNEAPVDLADLSNIDPAAVQSIRVFHTADALAVCDLIDMPGISDPNMPSEVWERLVDEIDAVIWCTHATQAWRQSEDAVWSGFPPEIQEKSLLLITRFDKIVAERDRKRLLRRVQDEVEGLFRGVYPISLTEAMAAEDDDALWVSSGADAFAKALIDLSEALSPISGQGWPAPPPATTASGSEPDPAAAPLRKVPAPTRAIAPDRPTRAQGQPRVMPQRVQSPARASIRPERPPRDEADPLGL